MEPSTRTAVLGDWLWFFAWGILSSLWCVAAAAEVGATFDEPIDLNNGLEFWRTGSHYPLLKLGAMPLPMDLASLPIYLWERSEGARVDFMAGAPYEALFWARVTLLAFWWLLLYYGRRIGRCLGGPWGGRLAVALLAVEPTLLAHAALATKDIAVTACLAAFVYHFRIGRDGPWLSRVGWPAFWFAASLLSKASAVAFAPLCMLGVELERLARLGALSWNPIPGEPAPDRPRWRLWLGLAWERLRPLRRDGFQLLAVGTVLVFVYCGSDWQPQQSFLRWARSLPEGPLGDTMVWTAEHLRLFSNAGEGIARQVTHNLRGHGVYILGRAERTALWYYFPVALSMKLTVPLLGLVAALAVVRPRVLTNWACVAAGVLLLYTVQCRVQIGVRLILPLVGIGIAGLAAASANAWRELAPGLKRHLLAAGIGVGLAWSAASAVLVWPHGLCYINELWGGMEDGYRLLTDSNYDWGQGVKELARWQQRHAGTPLDVWYFGTDPALGALPVHPIRFGDLGIKTPEEAEAAMRGRYIAVSTTFVYGAVVEVRPISDYLRTQQPVARTQTFLIYDFRPAGPAPAQ
jgi:hypothetical protein